MADLFHDSLHPLGLGKMASREKNTLNVATKSHLFRMTMIIRVGRNGIVDTFRTRKVFFFRRPLIWGGKI